MRDYSVRHYIALAMAGMIGINLSANAATYQTSKAGKFNDIEIWSPSYPGNIINREDTFIIQHQIDLNTDLVVKGVLKIQPKSVLNGEKNLVILESGQLVNHGISITATLTNRGEITNHHILETSKDCINQGNVFNQASMVIGNIMDNTGLMTGERGQIMASKKFINSGLGVLKGNINVCSNDFMNVAGGTIDSTYLSFCGQRIFNEVILAARPTLEDIKLELLNAQHKSFKRYEVERSTDGKNYELLASIMADQVADPTASFTYHDKEVLSSSVVYYRVRLTLPDDRIKVVAAAEIGSGTGLGSR